MLLSLSMSFVPRALWAQSEDLITRETGEVLKRSVWEVGPFRFTPSFRAAAGYDSDVFLSDIPRPDYVALVAPGIRAVVPFRERGYVEIFEEVDFVEYREQKPLNDTFNVTQVAAALGGSKVVVRGGGELRTQRVVSGETDVPVNQRLETLNAALLWSLGWRHELSASAQTSRLRVEEPALPEAVTSFDSLLGRTENTYSMRLTRHFSLDTQGFIEGFFERYLFEDASVARDSDAFGLGGGFVFSPTGNVRGAAGLGFKRVKPDSPAQPEFVGLVGTGDVTVALGSHFAVRGTYSREPRPSVEQNAFLVVTTQYGGSLDIYLGRQFSVTQGVLLGKNDYPESTGVPQGEAEALPLLLKQSTYSLGFHYHVTPTWRLSLTGNYSNRESTLPSPTDDRIQVGLEIATVF